MSRPARTAPPYRVAEVGKWWGLFRVPPLAVRDGDAIKAVRERDEEPVTVSWHATEADAERAALALTAKTWVTAKSDYHTKDAEV